MTRRRYVMATAIAASAFAAAFVAIAVANPLPRAIWNASASAPIGLYRIHPDRDPAIGALVAVAPPERLAHWLSTRGYPRSLARRLRRPWPSIRLPMTAACWTRTRS